MPIPWNRGDETDRAPTWVDLVPLLGDSAGGGPGEDRRERSDPVLVAPHRDPGEDAVNNDMQPGFERSRGSAVTPGESPAAVPETHETSPDPDRTSGDAGPGTVGPDAGSQTAATPSAATLHANTSHAAAAPDEEAPATDESETDDREDESRDSTDLEDSMPVNSQ